MKKLIAVILASILICSSFVSCGKEEQESSNPSGTGSSSAASDTKVTYADCSIEFSDVKKGYIDHTSGGAYTVTADDAFECTDDFYVYLPEGSVISCEKELGFFCYNDEFTLNSWMMRNSGQTLADTFNPTPAAGEYTLSRGCYVRFEVKGSLSDIKISVPEGMQSKVLCGSKADMAIAPTISQMSDYLSGLSDAVNYIFISDLHNGSYVNDPDGDGLRNYDSVEQVTARLESRSGTLETAVKYVNLCPYLDFIVVGGDIINGYETEESLTYQAAKKKDSGLTVKEHVIDQLQEMLAPLKKCEKPVFVLTGNHDYNDGHTLWLNTNHPENSAKRADYILSDLDWEKGVFSQFVNVDVVRDPDYSYNGKSLSKYCYYDLEKNGKTTRIICLDIKDGRQPFDANGNLTGDPSKNAGYCYSDKQMKWLAEVALMGDFDNCMVFAHSGMTEGTTKMEKILTSYQAKTAYSAGGAVRIDASYVGRTSGDIMLYHHGHEHENYEKFSAAMRLWRFSSSPVSIDIVSASPDSVYEYVAKDGTHTEFTRTGAKR